MKDFIFLLMGTMADDSGHKDAKQRRQQRRRRIAVRGAD